MKTSRVLVRRGAVLLGAAVVLCGSMGASCTPRVGAPFTFGGPQAPVVLGPESTAADIAAAVNANTARVQTYQASRATLSMPGTMGLPLLSSSIAVERPSRLRLRATTTITGPEVDIGSNDERFWVWARRNDPPGVYTATHAAFAASNARQQLPIDPAWLVDALGLPTIETATAVDGPFPRGDGTVEIRTQLATSAGPAQRVYLVDDRTAQVRQQHFYDATGSLVASVTHDDYRFDPVAGVSLPQEVELRVPAAQLALRISTGPVLLNAPIADGGQLWSMPQLNGYPVVDLAGATPIAANDAVWNLAGESTTAAPPIAQRFGEPAAPAASSAAPIEALQRPTVRAAFGRLPATGVALDAGR